MVTIESKKTRAQVFNDSELPVQLFTMRGSKQSKQKRDLEKYTAIVFSLSCVLITK